MLANQAGHGQACRNIVGDEAILLVEEEPIRAQDSRRAHHLLASDARRSIVGRFAVAEINDQRALSDLREFRNRPAHLHFGIVGMRRDDKEIIRYG
jgi:hypothetical protein